jgi:hypothetical protein
MFTLSLAILNIFLPSVVVKEMRVPSFLHICIAVKL